MRRIFTLVLAGIAMTSFGQTPTIKAIADNKAGALEGWTNPANWNNNRIPIAGDIVEIPSGQTITVKGQVYSTQPSMTILINGTLAFDQSGKLELGSAATIQIYSGGSITSTGSNSEVIFIGSELKYKGGVDPSPLNGPAFASMATGVSGSAETGFGAGVLPVKLKSFTAQAKGSRIILYWSTAEETNFSHFVVEKSTNARTWTSLQTITAQGTAASYSSFDGTPAPGDNFYRLKPVDIDGQFEYSQVLKVSGDKAVSAYISPNPATNQVAVSLSSAPTTTVQLQLVANSGQVVREGLFAKGSSLLRLGLQGVNPGIYTLAVRNGATLIEAQQLLVR